MRAMKCEICGSNDVQQFWNASFYVCANCQTRYDAKAGNSLWFDVDFDRELAYLYEQARSTVREGWTGDENGRFERILNEYPRDWETNLFAVVSWATKCDVRDIAGIALAAGAEIPRVMDLAIASSESRDEAVSRILRITQSTAEMLKRLQLQYCYAIGEMKVSAGNKEFEHYALATSCCLGALDAVRMKIDAYAENKVFETFNERDGIVFYVLRSEIEICETRGKRAAKNPPVEPSVVIDLARKARQISPYFQVSYSR